MDDVPQGGAGGAPLDDQDQKHPLNTPAEDTEPDSGEQGDATTAEPSRSRRLAPEEIRDEDAEESTES
ncbi:hypothetical protein [Kitasatospora cheerisanensis]|uniref:hypothetical protein n=1 Tax=Kitasatospora cheerisanensis TaxID=81942 RepID=UPI000562352B|nr:hypothetical protein [Kitasatospora cheerisanensis]